MENTFREYKTFPLNEANLLCSSKSFNIEILQNYAACIFFYSFVRKTINYIHVCWQAVP